MTFSQGNSGGASKIATASDVALNVLGQQQVLSYNAGIAKWQNQTLDPTDPSAARRPLIGGHCLGVGAGANTGANYLVPTVALEDELNAKFDIVSYYYAVGPDTATRYTQTVVPILTTTNRSVMYALEMWRSNADFISQFDSRTGIYPELVALFQKMVEGGNTERLFLAPFHEGNGGGNYPWEMYYDSKGNTPALYKAAFTRVVTLARSMGIKSKFIQWFLTSNGGTGDSQDIADGYVGDQWVDIVGVSYYNRSGATGYSDTWTPVGQSLRRFMRRVERMTGRSVWICETGCALSNQGEDKGQWYADLIRLVASNELPRIEAMIMFLREGTTTDMFLENSEQKRLVGLAMNAARRSVRYDNPSDYGENILPPAVSVPTSTDTWTQVGGGTMSISSSFAPGMSAGSTSLKVTKPPSDGASEAAYAVYRTVAAEHLDFEIGKPYVLTFKARASSDNFRLSAGIRQPTGNALFVGDTSIQLYTVWQTFTVPFATAITGEASWRIPYFRYGQNAQTDWFEVTDIRIAPGSYPQPNVDKTQRKRVRSATDAATIRWTSENTNMFSVTLAGNRTLAVPDGLPYDGQELVFRARQDATGGRTLTLAGGYRTSSVAVTIPTTPNSVGLLTFQYDAEEKQWGLISSVRWT